jgi:hypothetical protein
MGLTCYNVLKLCTEEHARVRVVTAGQRPDLGVGALSDILC